MGLAPLLVKEVFAIIRLNQDLGITILLVEQNARMALSVADYGYVMEQGRVVLDGTAEALGERGREGVLPRRRRATRKSFKKISSRFGDANAGCNWQQKRGHDEFRPQAHQRNHQGPL